MLQVGILSNECTVVQMCNVYESSPQSQTHCTDHLIFVEGINLAEHYFYLKCRLKPTYLVLRGEDVKYDCEEQVVK